MGHSFNINRASATAYANTEMSRSLRSYSAHTTDIREGRVEAHTHKAMNPKGVKVRESRDSTEHPTSLAIGVMFDVTGSMGEIPREVQRRLVNLMSLITTRGYVDHPHVLFGAVGDATSDAGPLQVGQFEAGLDMDKDLERVWVEQGGGSGHKESYELAHYFFARHVSADCWEKRQQKGYFFTLGDEAPYPTVSRSQVRSIMGDSLQADIAVADIVAELQEKWHVFHLLMNTSTSRSDTQIGATWRTLLPQGHVIDLADGKNVAEVVGMVIGINEGRVTNPESDLAQLGIDGASIKAVVNTLAPLERIIKLRS